MDFEKNRGNLVVGIILLLIGVMALFGQIAGPIGGMVRPVIVIGFGLAFLAAMVVGGRSLGFLAIPGTIISGIGVMLLIQNIFQLGDFMAYGWGLIICAVGIGLVIAGTWSEHQDMVRSGWKVAQVGLTLFLVFGILFEVIFNLGGSSTGLGVLFWPMTLALVGVGLLVLRSYRLIRGGTRRWEDVNLFWPVLFIGAGLLWLMIRLDMLEASQLTILINFWPVLLIAAGVDVLVGRRMQWVNLATGVLVVVGVFYVLFNAPMLGLSPRTPWTVFGISATQNQPVREWVSGSGPIALEARELKKFEKITLLISGDMEVVQGDEYAVQVEAEENLLPYIETSVEGNHLTIRTSPGTAITSTQGMRYVVTVKELNAVTLSGAGTITSSGLNAKQLNLTLNGFGTIHFKDLDARSVNVVMNGMGTVSASGRADEVVARVNGTGSVNLPELKTQRAAVTISGLGNATVWAVEQLDANFNGAGTVSYYGSPNTRQTSNGIGSLRPLGEK
jgi:hypothetical protein